MLSLRSEGHSLTEVTTVFANKLLKVVSARWALLAKIRPDIEELCKTRRDGFLKQARRYKKEQAAKETEENVDGGATIR